MQFRFHTGSFAESMATVVVINEYRDLKNLLEDRHDMKVLAIHFSFQGFDERNDWATYLVLADFAGVSPRLPVGWSDAGRFD